MGMLHLSSGTARCGSEPVKLPARSRGTEQGSAAGAEAWGTRSTVGRTGRATHAGYTCRVVATSEWSPHQDTRRPPPTFRAAPLRGVDQEEVPGVGEARRVTAVRARGPKRQLVVPVDGQGSEAHPGDVDEPAGAGRTGCGSLRAALGRVPARRACSDRRSGLRHAADSGHGRHQRTATGGRAGAAARPAPGPRAHPRPAVTPPQCPCRPHSKRSGDCGSRGRRTHRLRSLPGAWATEWGWRGCVP